MPEYTFVGTLQSTVKCLSLWNGSSNDEPPDGWFEADFDDSGWSFSANPSGSTGPTSVGDIYPNGAGGFDLVAGVQEGVAPFTTVPSPGADWLNRWYFISPAAPYEAYLLDKKSNGGGGDSEFFLNTDVATLSGTGGILLNAGVPSREITEIHAALQAGTNVIAWRANDFWPSTGFAAYHSLRLMFYVPDPGGRPVAWGTVEPGVNDQGVLGTPAIATILEPTYMDTSNFPDPDDPQVLKISSNGRTTFLLDNRGRLYACGDDDGVMHLGEEPGTTHPVPKPVTTAMIEGSIVDVAVGGDSVIVLTRHGGIWTMGLNAYGSAGENGVSPRPGFDAVGTFDSRGFKFIAAGSRHSSIAAVTDSPTVSCCGDNTYGQLGVGDTSPRLSFTPVNLALSSDEITMLTACEEGTIFTKGANTYACGRAEFGSLGFDAYDAGSGPNRIIVTPIVSGSGTEDTKHGGAITLYHDDVTEANQVELLVGSMLGDGVPYGGAADGDGTMRYGQDEFSGLSTITTGSGLSDRPEHVLRIADFGGLVNEWTFDDSKAVGALVERTFIYQLSSEEVLTAVDVTDAAGIQTQYLWPFGSSGSTVYPNPVGVTIRKIVLTIQNVAGGGLNPSVTAFLNSFQSLNPAIGTPATTSVSVPVNQSRVLALDHLLESAGVQVGFTVGGGVPRTNTITATLQFYFVDSTNDVLYTWGYGGYGQMGNGTTTETNLYAISQNGLSNVSQVCIARRVAFAVAETGAVVQVGRGRSWATVIG